MLPVIETERLTLRPVVQEDLPVLTRRIGDFDVAKMLARVPHPFSMADARGWLEGNCGNRTGGERAFAIDDGSGLIGVVSTGVPSGEPDFGYWLGKDFWGRGYMTEAGRAALGWLFGTTDANTVASGALNENPASLNVLRKLGFGEEEPYTLSIRSRGEDLPGTRVRLGRLRFEALESAVQ